MSDPNPTQPNRDEQRRPDTGIDNGLGQRSDTPSSSLPIVTALVGVAIMLACVGLGALLSTAE